MVNDVDDENISDALCLYPCSCSFCFVSLLCLIHYLKKWTSRFTKKTYRSKVVDSRERTSEMRSEMCYEEK